MDATSKISVRQIITHFRNGDAKAGLELFEKEENSLDEKDIVLIAKNLIETKDEKSFQHIMNKRIDADTIIKKNLLELLVLRGFYNSIFEYQRDVLARTELYDTIAASIQISSERVNAYAEIMESKKIDILKNSYEKMNEIQDKYVPAPKNTDENNVVNIFSFFMPEETLELSESQKKELREELKTLNNQTTQDIDVINSNVQLKRELFKNELTGFFEKLENQNKIKNSIFTNLTFHGLHEDNAQIIEIVYELNNRQVLIPAKDKAIREIKLEKSSLEEAISNKYSTETIMAFLKITKTQDQSYRPLFDDPILLAVKYNHPELIEKLSKNLYSHQKKNFLGEAMVLAAQLNNMDCLRKIHSLGIPFTLTNNLTGDTLLHYSARSGADRISTFLQKRGVKPNTPNGSGETAQDIILARARAKEEPELAPNVVRFPSKMKP